MTLFATPHVIIYDAVLFIVPALVLARDALENREWLVPVIRVPILSLPIAYLTWRLMSPTRATIESS